MFLPLGDEPNPRGVPVVTYALIGINAAVFLFVTLPLGTVRPDPDDPVLGEYLRLLAAYSPDRASLAELIRTMSAYDLVIFAHGYRPAEPSAPALLTSLFLHAGFMHLAGNMLFLWIYGDNVEHRLGRVGYLAAYFGTGVLATLSHALLNPASAIPTVGASGAISGVLGLYFIWFPRNRVRLWVMLFPFFMQMIHAPARLVLGMYLVIDNLLPFLANRGVGDGVAYGAHIGGFVGGLAWAWWSGRRELRGRPRGLPTGAPDADGEAAAAVEAVDPSSVRGIRAAIAAGGYAAAAPAYFRLSPARAARLLQPDDSIRFGRWLANHGHPDAALMVYQRHLRDYPLGPYAGEAHLGAGLVQLHARGQPTAAYQHLAAVLDTDPHPDTEVHARRALAEIARLQKFPVGRVG